MKWIDVIGLIAQSGEFKFWTNDLDKDEYYNLEGFINGLIVTNSVAYFDPKRCNLIARPMDDLSIEEASEIIKEVRPNMSFRNVKVFKDAIDFVYMHPNAYIPIHDRIRGHSFKSAKALIDRGVWAWDSENVEYRNKE